MPLPCKKCIILPICLSKYKNQFLFLMYITNNCSIVYDYFFKQARNTYRHNSSQHSLFWDTNGHRTWWYQEVIDFYEKREGK